MERWRAELYHHGILGQKWGKLNGPPYPLGSGDHSASEKKAGWRKSLSRHLFARKKDPYKNSKTESFTLKKGSTIHRVATSDKDRTSGHAYATFKEKDAKGYMKRSLLYDKNTFDMTMKATEDLISPSRQERIDVFMDLMHRDGTFSKTLAEAMGTFKAFGSAAEIESAYKKMSDIELRTRAYNNLALSLGFNEDVRKKYFSELSSRGYNMIVDDNDAQFLSNTPVIIFDRSKSLEVISVNRVTKDYIKKFHTE